MVVKQIKEMKTKHGRVRPVGMIYEVTTELGKELVDTGFAEESEFVPKGTLRIDPEIVRAMELKRRKADEKKISADFKALKKETKGKA